MAIYESEITGFLKKLKQEMPHLEAEQKKGRALLWDKQLDSGLQKGFELGRISQQPYVYQPK